MRKFVRKTPVKLGISVLFLSLIGQTASALEPLPACWQMKEAGMVTQETIPLGGNDRNSGVIIERYSDDYELGSGGKVTWHTTTSIAELQKFDGLRITHCGSGRFLIIPGEYDTRSGSASVSATEFVRSDIQAGKVVSLDAIKRAVDAIYGGHKTFQETEETCGCAAFFPELRPAGMKKYDDRNDVEQASRK